MPLLSALLGAAFTKLIEFFGGFLTRKVAIGIAWATFLIGGWAVLQLSLHGLWTALGFVIPATLEAPLKTALWLMPSNTSACISAIVSARVARWLWDRQMQWARVIATS